MICYVLGITSIDPVEHTLLFERFISTDRREPPDIDVDVEHERREEVIQWIYATYGHDHAALTAVVSRFRARGAVREVGKVLGLSEDVTAALAGQVWGWSSEGVADKHVDALNLDRTDRRLSLTLELARELIGTPRHLSQHPGGFILTRSKLHDLIPIQPAAMADRWVVEWEKEDIEELGFMKVDILGLGMLGCLRRAFDLLAEHKGLRLGMASHELQTDCPQTFAMISRADTLGTFQIESRAQMAMLPRMKPTEFYDIVIEVAIVRPGPIQGDMVHPYLKRREGKEKVEYPNEALKDLLEKTLGVPLFQEQAMKVAIVGAGFTPARASQLRRAMATFKHTAGVGKGTGLGLSMVHGLTAQSGGKLLIRSHVGYGTTVDLYLPVTVKPRAEQRAWDRRPDHHFIEDHAIEPLDVLVVDDDPLVLANTAAMLEDMGHSVRLAVSGEDALVQLARDPGIDLVVTDQLMPRMTGSQLCRRIRLGAPEMPVLIVSGFSELSGNEAGRFPMLAKPFDRAALARALANLRRPATVVPLRRVGAVVAPAQAAAS